MQGEGEHHDEAAEHQEVDGELAAVVELERELLVDRAHVGGEAAHRLCRAGFKVQRACEQMRSPPSACRLEHPERHTRPDGVASYQAIGA